MEFFGMDMQKSFKDLLEMQNKALKGMEHMVNHADAASGTDLTPKKEVYREDKMRIYHYEPLVKSPSKTPLLISYALVNKQYMMDIQQDRSMVKKFLELGLDVYIIDWGYPQQEDMFLTLDDYINGYLNNAVEFIKKENSCSKVNLLGVCQGGTFASMYSSIYPENINSLVTMVAPIDFSTNDGVLFAWGKHIDVDTLVDAYGIIPGESLNNLFLMLKPFSLTIAKYVSLVEKMDTPDVIDNFLRMERWIEDSPDQAGETIRQFINDFYKENKLVKGTLEIGDKKVNLKNIDMPLLNVYAEYDHIVPPSSTTPLNDLVSSKDKELLSFKVGHVGMYVSSKSQNDIAPKVAEWIKSKS